MPPLSNAYGIAKPVLTMNERWWIFFVSGPGAHRLTRNVINVVANTTYKLDTMGKMSGYPVVMNGKSGPQLLSFLHFQLQGTYLPFRHPHRRQYFDSRSIHSFYNDSKWAANLMTERLESKSNKRFKKQFKHVVHKGFNVKVLHRWGNCLSRSDSLNSFTSRILSLVDMLAVTVAEAEDNCGRLSCATPTQYSVNYYHEYTY